MRLYSIFLLAAVALSIFTACDEGRLYQDDIFTTEEGGRMHFTFSAGGADSWTEGYTLAVAGFEEGNEFALVSKNIGGATEEGVCDVWLTGIPAAVKTIEICALDRLRRRIATFVSVDYSNGGSYTGDSEGSGNILDISMSGAIQHEIFNTTCIQCHGGSNHSAAGLNLTEGKSFGELISRNSVKSPGIKRVEPGKSDLSLLYLILSGDYSTFWNYDHSVEVVRQEKLDLIRNWIEGGADTN